MSDFTLQGYPPEVAAALLAQTSASSSTGADARVLYSPSTSLNVYVNASTGDDANDGLTAATALKTLEQVYRAVPMSAIGGSQIIVNLAGPSSGTTPYSYSARVLFFAGHVFRGPDMIAAPVSTSSVTLDATCTTAATNRTRLNFATDAPAWTTNELRGYFCRIKRGGVLLYPEFPISENDADHLWLNNVDIDGSLLVTDTVEIVTPGAKIIGTNMDFSIPFLEIRGATSGALSPHCCLEKVCLGDFAILDPASEIQFDRVRGESLGAAFMFMGRTAFVNTSLSGGSVLLSGVTYNNDAHCRDDYTTGKFVDLQVTGGVMEVGANNQLGTYSAKYDTSVYAAPGNAISVMGPGSFFYAREASATVQGDGSTGVGILARRGGRASVPSTSSRLTITGSGGDLKVGSGAAISYGTGVGEFEEAAGFNGNFTRMLEGSDVAPEGDTSQIENVF